MARAIWSGSISFGLVNVPVKVYSAVKSQDLSFHQFEESTNARIRYKKVSEKTGREVPSDRIAKGYELSKGHYVMLDPEELDSFAPRSTRMIDIEDFVSLEEIDPIYYDHTYYLAPEGEGAERAYSLLLLAMENQQKVGIGRVVMRGKQYLAAIRPFAKGALALSTMLFYDEVVPITEVESLPVKKSGVSDREVKMAAQIIESLTREWGPKRYHDTYREQVLDFIEKKAAGEEVVVEEEEPEEPKAVDLMAALEASLAAAKKSGGTARSSGKAPAKKRPAKKQAAGKSTSSTAKRGQRARKSA